MSLQLVGYISDENYSAVPDGLLEFERDGQCLAVVRTSPSGAVYADLPAGAYRVTISRDGFGSKRTNVTIGPNHPCSIRLLSDSLYGYAWPKWVRGGESAEFRVHSP